MSTDEGGGGGGVGFFSSESASQGGGVISDGTIRHDAKESELQTDKVYRHLRVLFLEVDDTQAARGTVLSSPSPPANPSGH